MSNYIWTEKQIESAMEKFKNKLGWLNSKDFRILRRNTPVQDRQNLMWILVDRKAAFDNKKSSTSPKYRISFDWENKGKLLADWNLLIPAKLLFNPLMLNLPPEEVFQDEIIRAEAEALLGRPFTALDTIQWISSRSDWGSIWELLYEPQSTWASGVNKRVRSHYKALGGESYEDTVFALAKEIACMYATLKAGWGEVLEKVPSINPNCDEYFAHTVKVLSFTDFVSRCRGNTSMGGIHANLRRFKDIRAGMQSFKSYSGIASQLQPEDMERLFRFEYLGEEDVFILKPEDGGKSFECERFNPDKYERFYKAASSISINKDMMTPDLWELVLIGRGFELRRLLLASSNPTTKAKALEWEEASRASLSIGQRILWRLLEKKST
jgi:hypothetical protein